MTDRTLFCISRHGETDWNLSGILQGWIDVPLNARGREQSREIAERLEGQHFSLICSSPLKRAAETAEIVADAWGRPPMLRHPGLKERHFGHIQGMPKDELSRSHPGLHEEILRRNPRCDFEGGESIDRFADRVMDALTEIGRTHAGSRILVITHGWVMDVITRHVMQLPRTAVLEMKRKNGECLWIEMVEGSTLRAAHISNE
ncbi:histidine phosphatase family protein [Imhoffiella purpurea]|uniref:phosphoglycerate mutase (2,3-diphosphoglycerate-dependent) n=1 Tax=Imhoffiella purpurea TaxID=1249627 RepID=W9V1Q8_9GAMM|nr:histidine phosphatase family protein [Imhoffiella purpurea]EXJ13398.1 phosphoglycerate mutase family protein [Imhoffiella purpurea]